MHIVEFASQDGHPLLVRVDASSANELVTRGLDSSTLLDKAERTFESALQPIRTVADAVMNQLGSVKHRPDEVTVQFGLEFTASTSAILAAANAAATVSVQLTWKNPAVESVSFPTPSSLK